MKLCTSIRRGYAQNVYCENFSFRVSGVHTVFTAVNLYGSTLALFHITCFKVAK